MGRRDLPDMFVAELLVRPHGRERLLAQAGQHQSPAGNGPNDQRSCQFFQHFISPTSAVIALFKAAPTGDSLKFPVEI